MTLLSSEQADDGKRYAVTIDLSQARLPKALLFGEQFAGRQTFTASVGCTRVASFTRPSASIHNIAQDRSCSPAGQSSSAGAEPRSFP